MLIYFVYQRRLKSENTKKSKREKWRIFATDIIWKRKRENIETVTKLHSKEREKNYAAEMRNTEMKRKGRKKVRKNSIQMKKNCTRRKRDTQFKKMD